LLERAWAPAVIEAKKGDSSMKLLTLSAAALAVGITLIPEDASAQRWGYRAAAWRGSAIGWRAGLGYRTLGYRSYAAYRPYWGYRSYWGAYAAAPAAAYYAYASYPSYGYYPAYGYYPSYGGYYSGCGC
jgi:hypothetical protein